MADKQAITNQIRKYINRAHELTIKHQAMFKNSIISRELESYANRHLGGLVEREPIAQRQIAETGKVRQRVISHNVQSFQPDLKKNSQEIAAEDSDTSKMSVDELKVYAKREFGISTRGITKKDDILHLIEQYKIVRDTEVNQPEEEIIDEIPIDDGEEKTSDEVSDEEEKSDDDDMMKE